MLLQLALTVPSLKVNVYVYETEPADWLTVISAVLPPLEARYTPLLTVAAVLLSKETAEPLRVPEPETLLQLAVTATD